MEKKRNELGIGCIGAPIVSTIVLCPIPSSYTESRTAVLVVYRLLQYRAGYQAVKIIRVSCFSRNPKTLQSKGGIFHYPYKTLIYIYILYYSRFYFLLHYPMVFPRPLHQGDIPGSDTKRALKRRKPRSRMLRI